MQAWGIKGMVYPLTWHGSKQVLLVKLCVALLSEAHLRLSCRGTLQHERSNIMMMVMEMVVVSMCAQCHVALHASWDLPSCHRLCT